MTEAPEVPEYYRHLAKETPDPDKPASERTAGRKPVEEAESTATPARDTEEKRRRRPKAAAEPTLPYHADQFILQLPEDWSDRTVFTLTGPVTDGILHNITVNLQRDLPIDDLLEFADRQIISIEEQLKGCRLLLREPVLLDDQTPAYRAIFVWWPTEDLRLYQEQVYVLSGGTGFTLTASFTKKTRKTLGPRIERAMMSFKTTSQDTRPG